MKYIYDSHLGGIIIINTELSHEECYCEVCGDWDEFIGKCENLKQLWRIIRQRCSINGSGGYSLQYIYPLIVELFHINVEVPYDNLDYKSQGFCSLTDDQILEELNNLLKINPTC